MTYGITLAPAAARQLRKLDAHARRRIQAALELLAAEPRPRASTRLVGGAGKWRVRTGDYRIIYEIRDDELLVLRVGHPRGLPDVAGAATLPRPRGGGDQERLDPRPGLRATSARIGACAVRKPRRDNVY